MKIIKTFNDDHAKFSLRNRNVPRALHDGVSPACASSSLLRGLRPRSWPERARVLRKRRLATTADCNGDGQRTNDGATATVRDATTVVRRTDGRRRATTTTTATSVRGSRVRARRCFFTVNVLIIFYFKFFFRVLSSCRVPVPVRWPGDTEM